MQQFGTRHTSKGKPGRTVLTTRSRRQNRKSTRVWDLPEHDVGYSRRCPTQHINVRICGACLQLTPVGFAHPMMTAWRESLARLILSWKNYKTEYVCSYAFRVLFPAVRWLSTRALILEVTRYIAKFRVDILRFYLPRYKEVHVTPQTGNG